MKISRPETGRLKAFERNRHLEEFLFALNGALSVAENSMMRKISSEQGKFPIIFLVGSLRSGTTLFLQWLANIGLFAYPTNLLSRFYGAPLIGAHIQLLLTDPQYNFRDEILDFRTEVNFQSENGKTKGALAPNEFWYFWRRFLPFKDIDYMHTEKLLKKADTETLVAELTGITKIFKSPFALKAMILNYNIDFLDTLFEQALFIFTKRDPLTNIQSAIEARKRQFGSIDPWYSFKIPEYVSLKSLNSYEQVAGQIYYINKAVEKGLQGVAEHKKMTVPYEHFCKNPLIFFEELKQKLKRNGFEFDQKYSGEKKFNISRRETGNKEILSAYKKYFIE